MPDDLPALPWTSRLAVGGTAAADVALRTGVASGLVLPAVRWAASGGASGEAERLAYYRDLAERGDRAAIFQEPEGPPRVTASGAPFGPSSRRTAGSRCSVSRATSSR